jgi:hypothetical protein
MRKQAVLIAGRVGSSGALRSRLARRPPVQGSRPIYNALGLSPQFAGEAACGVSSTAHRAFIFLPRPFSAVCGDVGARTALAGPWQGRQPKSSYSKPVRRSEGSDAKHQRQQGYRRGHGSLCHDLALTGQRLGGLVHGPYM